MTINFDKVPRFVYFNEEGNGTGQVYFDGVRRKGLQKVKIEAQTKDGEGCHPLKYKIQYVELDTKGEPHYISNMENKFYVDIRILDMEEFKGLMDWTKTVISDERISLGIRLGYIDLLKEFTDRFNKEDPTDEIR